VTDFIRTTPPEVVRPAKLVTGEDVLDLGYKPGPIVGRILAAVEEAQLNGEVGSRQEAISFVESKFRQKLQESGKLSRQD
jgi:hypothetical protein